MNEKGEDGVEGASFNTTDGVDVVVDSLALEGSVPERSSGGNNKSTMEAGETLMAPLARCDEPLIGVFKGDASVVVEDKEFEAISARPIIPPMIA